MAWSGGVFRWSNVGVEAAFFSAATTAYMYATNPAVKFDLLKFDWQGAGAIGTAIAASFTAWAAWAAKRAADVALQVDGNQARRAEQERYSRAVSMSVALDHELRILSSLARIMGAPRQFRPNQAKPIFEDMLSGLDQIATPMLERYADHFTDFEINVAAQLTKLLSAVYQAKRKPPEPKKVTPEEAAGAVQRITMNAVALRREAIVARRRLGRYRRVILHRRRVRDIQLGVAAAEGRPIERK